MLIPFALILIATSTRSQEPSGIGPGRGGFAPWLSWARYTVEGEEFSVSLPALPAMTTDKVQTRTGKSRLERHLRISGDGVLYTIDAFEKAEPGQSLEEFIAEQSGHSGHDPATERNVTINGFAGKEYSSGNKTPSATVQFLATEQHFYQFAASGATADDQRVQHFFSSIVLSKETAGIKVFDGTGGDRIFTGREVDVKPRLLERPEPSYTEKARSNRIEGTVILKVIFSATGRVEDIRVVSHLQDGLTEQAIKAAKGLKFIPAMKDGKPVSMWMQLEYNFTL